MASTCLGWGPAGAPADDDHVTHAGFLSVATVMLHHGGDGADGRRLRGGGNSGSTVPGIRKGRVPGPGARPRLMRLEQSMDGAGPLPAAGSQGRVLVWTEPEEARAEY